MSDIVNNPHDAFFKQYLSQPTVAVDFLRRQLPAEMVNLLDFSTLQLEKDTFVDEQLRGYFSDLIYTTVTREQTPVRIALLCEHKSYPDPWVNFQVLRYQVGYWVREFDQLRASTSLEQEQEPPAPQQRRYTLTPILVLLVYHGQAEWKIPFRFARQLSGMEDPTTPLSVALARYVPDFESHFINLSTMADEAIQGEMVTRLFMFVLKHIFDHGLGGQLDTILQMASAVIRQPSGMEMVMALLRYIGRSAVQLDRAEIASKLRTLLPKEGGILMETMAQEWIDEGFAKGIEKGIEKGKLVAQRQTILRLAHWRFTLSEADQAVYAVQLDQIHQLDQLTQLVDHVLAVPTKAEFVQTLQWYLAQSEAS